MSSLYATPFIIEHTVPLVVTNSRLQGMSLRPRCTATRFCPPLCKTINHARSVLTSSFSSISIPADNNAKSPQLTPYTAAAAASLAAVRRSLHVLLLCLALLLLAQLCLARDTLAP